MTMAVGTPLARYSRRTSSDKKALEDMIMAVRRDMEAEIQQAAAAMCNQLDDLRKENQQLRDDLRRTKEEMGLLQAHVREIREDGELPQATLKEKMTTGPVLILPDLQKSFENGHDGIWTFIDRFSKQAHFVPVKKTDKPNHLARLFVAQIFRLHGMPETIVSDSDPRFTSLFLKAIWANIGTRLQFSSSFHPQTDGQSEIANSVVLDLLKSYISDQKTQWERCLPLVEFAYNNTIHSSTGKAPFEIVKGVRKVPPFLSTKDKILKANEYTRDLDTDFAKVRETLQKSQERQKKAADHHRRDSKLKENDWVLLRFDKARLRQKKGKEELSMRYYGPFQITEQINDISFRLRLPDTWKIHNVFHVNLWETFGDVPDDGEPDEQPEVEANEEILVPEQVLAHKVTKKGKARRRFLIEFKNFPAFDAKWMEEEDLADTPQILELYLEAFGIA
ncbi:hypothetical protein L7F22_034676 [Adiantum nelumboides]|nr:hypothetical protein [Adiantum nelumboides]